jgi:hypothetical protein
MSNEVLEQSIRSRGDIGKLTTLDRVTLNTSSKFGISLQEHADSIKHPEAGR